MVLCTWEGNCRFDVTLAMHLRLHGIPTCRCNSLGVEPSTHLPSVMYTLPFLGNHYKHRFALCYGTDILSVCNVGVLWPKCCMDQDATWYGGRPQPRPHCVRWGSSSPPHGKGLQPATFWLMYVAKRSSISAAPELLLPATCTFCENHNHYHFNSCLYVSPARSAVDNMRDVYCVEAELDHIADGASRLFKVELLE